MNADPEDSLLPNTTTDEDGVGWGEATDRSAISERDAWYQRERPPHHEG